MNPETLTTIVLAILGSNFLVAVVTVIATRKKNSAEVTEKSVQTVLAIEERSHQRYQTTAEALEEAESLLKFARRELEEQAKYIEYLKSLLEEAEIEYVEY